MATPRPERNGIPARLRDAATDLTPFEVAEELLLLGVGEGAVFLGRP